MLFESSLAAGPARRLRAGDQRRRAVPQVVSFLLDSLGKRCWPTHLDVREDPHHAARQGQRAVRRRRRARRGRATSSTPASSQSYFLSSYSARKLGMRTTGHAGGSQNLTLTSAPHAARRRPRRDAAQARPRPVRHRADGAGRQLRDRRLFARRGRLLGRGRRDRLPGARDHHRRQPARRCSSASSRSAPTPTRMGSKTDRLGADRADEDRRRS